MSALKGGGLQSFRYQFGGDTAMAIAELIDNSIQWKKDEKSIVEVRLIERYDADAGGSRLAEIQVLDNGLGMDAKTISTCLDFGGGANLGTKEDGRLGKFGLGLPYASCSQSLNYTVYSWQNQDILAVQRNHFDYGPEDNVLSCEPFKANFDKVTNQLNRQSEAFSRKSGTLVIWSQLDRKKVPAYSTTLITHCEFLFGRIYRGFINNNTLEIRLLRIFDDEHGLDIQSEHKVKVNDPLFLSGNKGCPAPYNTGSTNEIIGYYPQRGMDKGDDPDTPGQRTFIRKEQVNGEELVHKVIVRHSRVKQDVYNKLAGLKASQSPIIKYYRDSNGISLMRAGRELKLSDFKFAKSGFSEQHRWYSIEVSFEPISDEIFDVDANKTDARKFRYTSDFEPGQLEVQSALMNDLSDYITGLMTFHLNAIKQYGKSKKRTWCGNCEKNTIEDGKCLECGLTLEFCPIHKKVRLIDGKCVRCDVGAPKLCLIHKMPIDEDGNCPSCPGRIPLSQVEKGQVDDFLESYKAYRGNKKLKEEAIKQLEKANGQHFFLFREMKKRDSFIEFETIAEKFTLIEINTRHAFYEMVISKLLEDDNDQGLEAIKFLIGTMALNESRLHQHREALETARSNMGIELQQLLSHYNAK